MQTYSAKQLGAALTAMFWSYSNVLMASTSVQLTASVKHCDPWQTSSVLTTLRSAMPLSLPAAACSSPPASPEAATATPGSSPATAAGSAPAGGPGSVTAAATTTAASTSPQGAAGPPGSLPATAAGSAPAAGPGSTTAAATTQSASTSPLSPGQSAAGGTGVRSLTKSFVMVTRVPKDLGLDSKRLTPRQSIPEPCLRGLLSEHVRALALPSR